MQTGLTANTSAAVVNPHLDFLWLELTNQCNLECKHCYSLSSPTTGHRDVLSTGAYREILRDARIAGCRKVQFIGGEATLVKDLPDLVRFSHAIGFEFVEIFSNLVSLSPRLVDAIVECGAHVATSVYSEQSQTHDSITTRAGSWKRTIQNLKKLLALGVSCRASIIVMEENEHHSASTEAFLREIGVEKIGIDHVRGIGRSAQTDACCSMDQLCGNCANGVLCVSSDGSVFPCIMAREWKVGSILESQLPDVLRSTALTEFQKNLGMNCSGRQLPQGTRLTPCSPDDRCSPCGPADCSPARYCEPHKF